MPDLIDYDRHIHDAAALRRAAMADFGHSLARSRAGLFRRAPSAAQPVTG
jgi:hypothetical protein